MFKIEFIFFDSSAFENSFSFFISWYSVWYTYIYTYITRSS